MYLLLHLILRISLFGSWYLEYDISISFQALEELYLKILDFWLYIELSILEWFWTWVFNYPLIPVRSYFQTIIALLSSSWPFS